MKKLLITFLLAIMSLFTLTSCVTTAAAQDEVSTSIQTGDLELAIRYGTPYIVGDAIIYYFYNNLYYYPFYSNGYYYRVFSRPLPVYPRHWRPISRNWHKRFGSNEFRYHHSGRHHIDRTSVPNRTFTPRSRGTAPRGNRPRNNGGGHFDGRR